MTILLVAEHDNQTLASANYNVASAARKIGGEVTVLVAGKNCAGVAQSAAKIAGVAKVLHADNAAYGDMLAENLAKLIAEVGKNYRHILAPATTFGKDLLPRAAALLDSQQVSDITEVIGADTFVRPIYAGNALATVQCGEAVKMITVRPTSFDKAGEGGNAPVEPIGAAHACGLSSFVSRQESKSDRPELASAAIVVSGGRGVGSKENFKVIYDFADSIGAAVGASRAAVDAGYISNDCQVGQTGKVVAPQLYFAIGISGAIQHLAGMKESKVVVAINKDENAPIFEVADYGLVGDLFEVVPQLQAALGK